MKNMKKITKRALLISIAIVVINVCFCAIAMAKPSIPSYLTMLTLENNPQICGIAILKLEIIADFDKSEVDIGCFIPDGLEIVRDPETKIILSEPIVSPEKGNRIVFYSGPMRKGEKKEFIFRIRVLDGRRYIISGGAVGKGDYLEIDLGDLEPPENRDSSLGQISAKRISGSNISNDEIRSVRTELRIRTKDKPYIAARDNPKEIPLRYLIYSEEELKNVEVSLELPEGLDLINDGNYEVSTQEKEGKKFTEVKIFQGPMRFKECKAVYLKVGSNKKERFRVKVKTKVLSFDDRETIINDCQNIELERVLY